MRRVYLFVKPHQLVSRSESPLSSTRVCTRAHVCDYDSQAITQLSLSPIPSEASYR